MAAIRDRFVAGCQRPAPDGPGFTPQQARTLWEQVEPFTGYGFNQGHATAYADVSFRSAYMKAHWPAAFLCARLANWGGYHYASTYMAEARRLGIAVRPPHINHSNREFTLSIADATAGADAQQASRNTLWMGLGQVRDLRQAAIEAIMAARAVRPFRDLADLLARVPLQAREIANLIRCGGLDGLGASRAGLLAAAEGAQHGAALQIVFGFMQITTPPESPADRLGWERETLGQPVSVHPLDLVAAPAGAAPLNQIVRQPGQPVTTAGIRLPGGTGGKGFFLADRDSYIIAIPPQGMAVPPSWQPVVVSGRWCVDEWGGEWLQIERMEALV